MDEEPRRLERPWMVEETASTFIVRTANRLVVSMVYFDNEPRRRSFNLTKDEASAGRQEHHQAARSAQSPGSSTI
jgi:hypothetical protein